MVAVGRGAHECTGSVGWSIAKASYQTSKGMRHILTDYHRRQLVRARSYDQIGCDPHLVVLFANLGEGLLELVDADRGLFPLLLQKSLDALGFGCGWLGTTKQQCAAGRY